MIQKNPDPEQYVPKRHQIGIIMVCSQDGIRVKATSHGCIRQMTIPEYVMTVEFELICWVYKNNHA